MGAKGREDTAIAHRSRVSGQPLLNVHICGTDQVAQRLIIHRRTGSHGNMAHELATSRQETIGIGQVCAKEEAYADVVREYPDITESVNSLLMTFSFAMSCRRAAWWFRETHVAPSGHTVAARGSRHSHASYSGTRHLAVHWARKRRMGQVTPCVEQP